MVQRYQDGYDGNKTVPYATGWLVAHKDYLSLKAALMEALDRWQQIEGETLYKGMAADRERIAELRNQFLD